MGKRLVGRGERLRRVARRVSEGLGTSRSCAGIGKWRRVRELARGRRKIEPKTGRYIVMVILRMGRRAVAAALKGSRRRGARVLAPILRSHRGTIRVDKSAKKEKRPRQWEQMRTESQRHKEATEGEVEVLREGGFRASKRRW